MRIELKRQKHGVASPASKLHEVISHDMSVIPEKINIIVLSEIKRFNSMIFPPCLVYSGVFLVLPYL